LRSPSCRRRVHLEARHGRLLARPAAALAGLIEVRGLGVRRLDYESVAVVGLVVDLAAEDAERVPAASETVLLGVPVRRLALPRGAAPLAPVLALLRSPDGDIKPPS
jgi:HPr kinase/phosphorylase